MARMLDNLDVLTKILALRPAGLITDIDGTISPSSHDPLHVSIPPENRRLLSALAARLAVVAVLSGRAAAEIREMINIENVKCIGHYGLEWSEGDRIVLHPAARPFLPAMRALMADIEPLSRVPGVVVQDKGATISLHYRTSLHPDQTRNTILESLARSSHIKTLRIMEEKKVVGIVPPVDYDKGDAVMKLSGQYRLRSAVFLGDDTADVPGFRVIRRTSSHPDFKGLAILVTSPETPEEIIAQADFTLDGVKETGMLLQWLVDYLR